MKKIRVIFVLYMLLFLCLRTEKNLYAGEKENQGRVLFISSYSYAWETVRIQIDGIVSEIGENVVIDYEFMDTKRVDSKENTRLFFEALKYKMENVELYDVIILGDDAALEFAIEFREELFKDIPLIFEGVNNEELAIEVSKDPLITGIVEKLSIHENIEFAKIFIPNAKKVVCIVDNSATGQAELKNFYNSANDYTEYEYYHINSSELATSDLKQALNEISKDTIVLFIVMADDASGTIYSSKESVEFVCENVDVPVFRMVSGGMGQGILGGSMVSMKLSGAIAAKMAMDIIGGKEPSEIAVMLESPSECYIDEAVMNKFKLDLSLIPKGTIVENHEMGFFEKYRDIMFPSVTFIVVVSVIILIISVDNINRRRLTKDLSFAKEKLQNASEHDFLTGLSNRSKFTKDLKKYIKEKTPCAVMMVDIDNFKDINDEFGHVMGDTALVEIGKRLSKMSNSEFKPYRFAGDEFIIIICSVDRVCIQKYVDRCLDIFREPVEMDDNKHTIYGSFGIATYPNDATDMKDLVSRADAAMYKVKKNGKNSYSYYNNVKQE